MGSKAGRNSRESYCLVPHGRIEHGFNREVFGHYMGEGVGNVEIEFSDLRDWATCFPASDKTGIFKDKNGRQAWAAIALCERVVGLSVFAKEEEGGGVRARIQLVPDQALQLM